MLKDENSKTELVLGCQEIAPEGSCGCSHYAVHIGDEGQGLVIHCRLLPRLTVLSSG